MDVDATLDRLKREHGDDGEAILSALTVEWQATLTPDYSSWAALCASMLPGQERDAIIGTLRDAEQACSYSHTWTTTAGSRRPTGAKH